jgi:hypothetical protein
LDPSGAGSFLVSLQNALFFGFLVTMLARVFAVLFAAFKAFVALSAVGGVTVAFELVALAVWAG